MIDHVLGRPSVQFRKIQVLAVVSFWSVYLYKGDRNGPPFLRRLSSLLSARLTTWQTLVITLLWLYISRNFGKLVGLECPEPLANLYSRSYFRATWVTTALDAGFWTAMRIRRKWTRDLLSVVFSIYYMICAEQADEKVRKIRATLTVEHLRVSWNKGTTPYLNFFTSLLRPRLMRYPPREIRIPRPSQSAYKEPVHGWLYYDGPLSKLKEQTRVVLDVPGGGFVAMNPRNHDDKLMGWAGRTGLPVLSLDYRKAPEHPYPYALNECYDVYHSIVASRGRCVGLSGETVPRIVVSGDSAGGNLAVGMVLMVLQSGSTDTRRWQGELELPPPVGVVLNYPALDMNIGNWMTDEQMALIRDRRSRKTNQGILRRKSEDYRHLAPNTPLVSDDEDEEEDDDAPNGSSSPLTSPPTAIHLSAAHTGIDTALNNINSSSLTSPPLTPFTATRSALPPDPLPLTTTQPHLLKTRLAMSSMISYFSDRILTPEMMRAMIILYIGPHHRPDFSTDYLLSPLLAPEHLLARFPRVWFLTGERDPLVDDTVIFAGRVRQAKRAAWVEARELGLPFGLSRSRENGNGKGGGKYDTGFREEDFVNVELVPGVSHGFLQFVGVFPEGWGYIRRCGRWMVEAFESAEAEEEIRRTEAQQGGMGAGKRSRREGSGYFGTAGLEAAVNGLSSSKRDRVERHHFRSGTQSSADEDRPLEMTISKPKVSPPAGKPVNGDANGTASGKTGRDRKASRAGNERGRGKGRRKSLVSLASEDDLLGRRMKGLTGGLLGNGEGGGV
ncbi:alpha/beta-hydrolase [Mytilinidion resinicola]|uniref:Alpha/beta-hydrolase n=1 Tax=Mytilinidion resinicola TaxID=574789 RepID=A0A6A6Y4H2_9PEZI|nr:alpha/beta-hydrolase [Mytilinidion resinicola]KAF2803529.1 alpha/beta-hydrolase [Mytilinidion resinicola]